MRRSEPFYTNIASGYIDLASFDGPICDQVWGKTERPWFTVVQVSRMFFQPELGGLLHYNLKACEREILHKISLEFTVPEVRLKNPGAFKRLRWTRNLAHNIIEYVSLNIGQKELWRFDSVSLDYIKAFRANDDYYRLIGNIPELINPTQIDHEEGICLPSKTVWLPLDLQPEFIAVADQGEMKLTVKIRRMEDLIIVDDFLTGISRPVQRDDVVNNPQMNVTLVKDCHLFNSTHKTFPHLLRTALFNSTKTIKNTLSPTHFTEHVDVDSSGVVHCMYFGLRNIANPADHSNYSTIEPYLGLKYVDGMYVPGGVDFEWQRRDAPMIKIQAHFDSLHIPRDITWSIMNYYFEEKITTSNDPINSIRFMYEGSTRIHNTSDFFSQLHPYTVGGKIPKAPGYHMYCFGPSLNNIDCATNFGQLTNLLVRYELNSIDLKKFKAFVILHTYNNL
jgi:hypothetical protein